jgi:membrane protease YdiL (CAAX protease family)
VTTFDTVPVSKIQRVLALGALSVFAVSCIFPLDTAFAIRLALAAAGLAFAVAGLFRFGPGAAVSILAFSMEALVLTKLDWRAVMPLALATLFLSSPRHLIKPYFWVQRGSVPGWATFACAAATPLFLVGWTLILKPDVTDLKSMVPHLATPLLVIGSVGFAIVNAWFEEWIWRGVLHACLTEVFPVAIAVTIQALTFGTAHIYGFPRGVSGAILAGTWALLLGTLRIKSRGLLAPFLAHFVADMIIALLFIFWFR